MTTINTNVMSMNAQRNLMSSQGSLTNLGFQTMMEQVPGRLPMGMIPYQSTAS